MLGNWKSNQIRVPIADAVRTEIRRALWLMSTAGLLVGGLVAFAFSRSAHALNPAEMQRSPGYSKNKVHQSLGEKKFTKKRFTFLEPCRDGLKLHVSYQAANPIGPARPMELEVFIQKDGVGRASNHRAPAQAISQRSCKAWQTYAWPNVDRMIAESRRPSRRSFQCLNVAKVEYTLGEKKSAKQNLCIGSAKEDGMSNAFYEFWDQTSLLAHQMKRSNLR